MRFSKLNKTLLAVLLSKRIYFLVGFVLFLLSLEWLIRNITGLTSMERIAENTVILLVIGLLLLFATRMFKLFLLLFLLFSVSFQVSHALFYGGWLEPVNLFLLFDNLAEVLTIIPNLATNILAKSAALISVAVVFLLFVYAFVKKNKGYYWVNFLVILLFAFQPIRDGVFKPERIEKRFTKNNHGLIRSSHNSFGVLFSMLISESMGNQLYPDFRLPAYAKSASLNGELPNVYIYFGESLSAKYMSTFGYAKNTTPKLKKILNSKKIYVLSKEAHSGALATMASTVRFFHLIQKPDARKQAGSFATSLFRYAKEVGYNTSYISTQAENYISHIYKLIAGRFSDAYLSPSLIDKTKESKEELSDHAIFSALEYLPLHAPFFSVFQPNGSHAPFAPKTTAEFKHFGTGSEVLEYENSVFQTDFIISELLDKIIAISGNKDWVFVITSDHGTYVDEAHISRSLDYPASYMVPGIVLTNNQQIYQKYLAPFRRCTYLSHQNISEIIARIMGYDIAHQNCDKSVLFGGSLNGFGAVNLTVTEQGRTEITTFKKPDKK